MRHDVSKRLNKALDAIPTIPKGYGRTSAASKLFGESTQVVHLWISAKTETKRGLPGIEKIPHVAKILGVSIDWLLTGKGPMHKHAETKELFINSELLGSAVQFTRDRLTVFGFEKLAYHKKGEVLALVYETLRDQGEVDDSFVDYLKRHIKVLK